MCHIYRNVNSLYLIFQQSDNGKSNRKRLFQFDKKRFE